MRIPLLDHGYIELIETWGSDERIIESARMSTNKGFRQWGTPEQPGDEKLLAFLYNNKHMSPFEMAGMTVEVCAPLFVFREWHRHRTQSYNEMSGRYTKLPDFNYVPTLDRALQVNAPTDNKQAQGTAQKKLDTNDAVYWLQRLEQYYAEGEELYKQALSMGFSKELARLPITVGRYSKMRASANLRNWLHFTELRSDKAAQEEIRVYSDAALSMIKQAFPQTHKLICQVP